MVCIDPTLVGARPGDANRARGRRHRWGTGQEMGTLAGQGEGTSAGGQGDGDIGEGGREMGHWRGTGGWPPCAGRLQHRPAPPPRGW